MILPKFPPVLERRAFCDRSVKERNTMTLRCVALGILTSIGVSCAFVRGDDEAETLLRAERLAEMTKRWQAYEASVVRDDKATKLEPHLQPLLRWNDPARKDAPIKDGSLWAWGTKGRPAALLTQESYRGQWVCELISVSTADRVAVVTNSGWRWSPKQPGLQLLEFKEVPSPAENAPVRLAQMRALARRFEIVQIGHDDTIYKLRFMPQPIHRYDDTSSGLIDGALFTYAWGTNPEAIAVVECQRKRSKSTWRYGFLPITVARIEAKLEGEKVWSRPSENQPKTQKTYTAFNSE